LCQIIADRAEQAVLLTMNLPFSEWTQVTPNAKFAKRSWIASQTAPQKFADQNEAFASAKKSDRR
jgi:hypothetical protein